MNRISREIDHVIRFYRDDPNNLDKKLLPHLNKISAEVKGYIISFCEEWDRAIREKNLLSSGYDNMACVLNELLTHFELSEGFDGSVLISDIKHFIFVQNLEKDNEWNTANAEQIVLNDVNVLHYCYEQWC